MLGKFRTSSDHLYIPKLIHLKEKAVVINETTQKVSNLHRYRLDWNDVDQRKFREYQTWVNDHWKQAFPEELTGQGPSTLPDVYDSYISGLEFAIPKSYMDEINYFSQLFVSDRMRNRPFDTIIRDMCLQASTAMINCAFKLLADCIYDKVKLCFWRGDETLDKWSAKSLMMYKFWRLFTGRGLVFEHACLDHLQKYAERNREEPNELCVRYTEVLDTIKRFEKDQEKFWSFCTVENSQTISTECEGDQSEAL